MMRSDFDQFAQPGELVAAATLFGAMSHPLRLHILRAFGDDVRSPHGLQQGMELTLGLVAYHVRKLRDDGLVELVSKRPVRGSVESFYRLTDRGRWACAALDAAVATAQGDARDTPGGGRRVAALARLEIEQGRVAAAERRAEAGAVRAESRQARLQARQLRERLARPPA